MNRYGIFFLTLLVVAVFAPAAQAKVWKIDYANSHVGFTGTQSGKKFTGGFKTFQVTIDFNPDKPETGKISATIDMGSAFADSGERSRALPQTDWFDSGQFPQAQFVSTSIAWDRHPAKPVIDQNIACYKVSGNLSIKAVTQPVTMSFCLVPEGNNTRAKGVVTLLRLNFGVGNGQWKDVSFIKNEVNVTLDILAR